MWTDIFILRNYYLKIRMMCGVVGYLFRWVHCVFKTSTLLHYQSRPKTHMM